jgi:Zn-dependent M28 family amino/carboxypeptidase
VVFDGDPAIARSLEPVAAALRPAGAGVVRARDGAGSDLIPMWVAGVPAFSPLQDVRTYFHYHHSAADTLDKIDPVNLRENTAVMAVLGYFLAAMEERLPQRLRPMPEWMKEDE